MVANRLHDAILALIHRGRGDGGVNHRSVVGVCRHSGLRRRTDVTRMGEYLIGPLVAGCEDRLIRVQNQAEQRGSTQNGAQGAVGFGFLRRRN